MPGNDGEGKQIQRAERDDYKATLSQQETVEDLGNITITKPTDAPEDAVVRNTEDNAGEDGSEEGSDQTPAEDKTEQPLVNDYL